MARRRRQAGPQPMNSVGELSSASELLRGMRFRGGKFPGHRVIDEVRKGPGDVRLVKFFGGQTRKVSKREIAELARDRGFDVSLRRFNEAQPEDRVRMLRGSLRWQEKAKARYMQRYEKKLGSVKSPVKRKRLEQQMGALAAAPVRSPLTGSKPVSGYVRRFWD
jgi:hypothetical protein